MTTELTETQNEVLKTIGTSEKKLYASELARTFNKSQAAVSKNIEPLIKEKLVETELEYKGGKQFLKLTDKGRLYLFAYGGINIEKFLEEREIEYPYFVRWLKKVIPGDPQTRQLFYEVIYQEFVLQITFDKKGHLQFTPFRKEIPELLLDLIITIIELRDAGKIKVDKKALRDFVSNIRTQFDNYFENLQTKVN